MAAASPWVLLRRGLQVPKADLPLTIYLDNDSRNSFIQTTRSPYGSDTKERPRDRREFNRRERKQNVKIKPYDNDETMNIDE